MQIRFFYTFFDLYHLFAKINLPKPFTKANNQVFKRSSAASSSGVKIFTKENNLGQNFLPYKISQIINSDYHH